jgi:hypothetical protein
VVVFNIYLHRDGKGLACTGFWGIGALAFHGAL